ncbi:hypothetical protein LS70_003885 [Helicobacter sp. MIT 11-5569]|uniref:hypothetical protein n=1 Tax=Helicobacter sp. MIT 11-5569 TaxID=1548151 RepID=UPI00051FD8C3|nr:hypothetical protein [Helicobacter sp. MIT 11-5569]TLD83959.1 hypothetical protein LS70_003885 [Helicobacter sp. MIT 11-5569]
MESQQAEGLSHAQEFLEIAQQVESLGVVGIFFVMLIIAITANYFLFKHAMANCGGMREIQSSLESLSRAIEKTNETQRLSVEIVKEFSEKESAALRESLARETENIRKFHIESSALMRKRIEKEVESLKDFLESKINAASADSKGRLKQIEQRLEREGYSEKQRLSCSID